MKKILSLLTVGLLIVLLSVGFLVWQRYQKNSESLIPYPYRFENSSILLEVEAPILIVGDRMAEYLNRFQVNLADTISANLVQPIKIQNLAQSGKGIHRTLRDLGLITKWPQIIIYQGGSEEFMEEKFLSHEASHIKSNFKIYQDDRIQSLIRIYPWLSRIFYFPVEKVILKDESVDLKNKDLKFPKRLEIELMLFEEHLKNLVSTSQDRNALLILTTTPINLNAPPKKTCQFTNIEQAKSELKNLRDLLLANNPKQAYSESSKLIQKFLGNAELLFLHGQVAKRLGKKDEALTSLLKASAFDCNPWRATEVQNSIIRKVARENQVMLFDFAKMMEGYFDQEEAYFDELYPQNHYYEKAMEQLGMAIKDILKL